MNSLILNNNKNMLPVLSVRGLSKTFTLHTQGGVCINAFSDLNLDAFAGRCLVLHGPSGAGKSTLLRSMYANYKPCSGNIFIEHEGQKIDIAAASPREILEIRRKTMGYVSQFLRVIPRVSTLNIVAEQCTMQGETLQSAQEKAKTLLERLCIPERLWQLAPSTFSGGEQQRVNIARGFIRTYPLLLLDEPTASLDAANRNTVIELIQEAKKKGCAVIGIFHDENVREAVADDIYNLQAGKKHAS